MKLTAVVLAIACACGGGKSSGPSDLGACTAIEKDGKPYYLCERTGGKALSNTAPAERPPAETEPKTEAELQLRKAQLEAEEARKAAQEAQEQLDRIAQDLAALDAKVNQAVDSVIASQNDADRSAAKAKLAELQREQAEMRARVEGARAAAAKAQRASGIKISKECLDNPLAKGCN